MHAWVFVVTVVFTPGRRLSTSHYGIEGVMDSDAEDPSVHDIQRVVLSCDHHQYRLQRHEEGGGERRTVCECTWLDSHAPTHYDNTRSNTPTAAHSDNTRYQCTLYLC
jgi:hypothetical protein